MPEYFFRLNLDIQMTRALPYLWPYPVAAGLSHQMRKSQATDSSGFPSTLTATHDHKVGFVCVDGMS